MFVFHDGALPFYRSTALPVPHGFSTRLGGVSGADPAAAHLRSLNFGENRGDTPENVRENFARFTSAAGLPYPAVAVSRQEHGTRIISVTAAGKEDLPYPVPPAADGFFTAEKGVTLCVKVADCIPILLCSLDETRPAVAALHAGWRGSVAAIAREGVRCFKAHGVPPEKLAAAIGPGIGACCYEVGEDFLAVFCREVPDPGRFLSRRDGKAYADLKALNRQILLDCGVPEGQIDVCAECTCCHSDRFFSHRASKGMRGSMAAMIAVGE